MSPRRKWISLAALGLHFFLVINISLQDFSVTLASGNNLWPKGYKPLLERTYAIASASLGRELAFSNPLRQALTAYADATGIEAGYSYFAPSVPGNSKLVFELHYPDGRVEYDLPVVGGAAAGYRISTLLDHLRALHYLRLREAILRALVKSIHREHPDAVLIRATFGVADLTSPAQYRSGKRTSYQPLYAYEFRFRFPSRPSRTRPE